MLKFLEKQIQPFQVHYQLVAKIPKTLAVLLLPKPL